MKTWAWAAIIAAFPLVACKGQKAPPPPAAKAVEPAPAPASEPPLDEHNIVRIALASKDHTTLVTALRAADYVGAVAASGPLTVFAPTNDAFAKLPAGTVEGLLQPAKAPELREILKYHVTTSVYEAKDFTDGQVLAMADGAKATIHVQDGKIRINDANVLASVRASNGIVHVIDGVLLPPSK